MSFPTEKHLQDFEKDKFNYKTLSKRILDEVLLKMELPNCFGFYGNWGSGKSTIINYIQQHLGEKTDESYKKVIFVYFEPWKYEYSNQSDLLFALLNCIKKKHNNNKNVWKKIMVDVAVIGSSILRKTTLADTQEIVGDFKIFEDKFLNEHEIWIDKIEELQKNFEEVIAKTLKKNKASKLVIFIDDLDRCLPENAVKLLEGIKNFLLIENTLFVIAIDRRVISEMVEKKYGLHDGYGDEYLTKIIHYYYELPTVSLKDVIKETLSTHNIETNESQCGYMAEFLKDEAKEPRYAKHIIHQLGMAINLSEDSKKDIKEDTQNTSLKYLFVASFLLTKFPKLFSSGDPATLIRNIRDSANILKTGNNHGDEYRKIVDSYNISQEIRTKLENIVQHSISRVGESSPEKIINSEKLTKAIKQLRAFQ